MSNPNEAPPSWPLIEALRLSIFLTCLTPILALASPEPICEIIGSDRVRTITYSPTRMLSVVGHEHGVTSDVLQLTDIADDTKSDNETYRKNGPQALAQLRETLTHYREDVAFIKDQVRSGKLSFIALEYGPKVMKFMQESARMFRPYLRKNLMERGLKEEQWMDDAFLVFAGPALYLKNAQPEIMDRVKIIGVEDEDLMQKSLDEVGSGEQSLARLQSRTDVTREAVNALTLLWTQIIQDYDVRQYNENDPALTAMKSRFPTSSAGDVHSVFTSAISAAETLRERDRQSSKKFLAEPGSGLLLIGAVHARAMSKLIQSDCSSLGPKLPQTNSSDRTQN